MENSSETTSILDVGPVPTLKGRRRHDPKPAHMRIAMSIRNGIIDCRLWVFRRVFRMDIGKGVRISLKANLDFTNPRGVHIGDDSYIAFYATVLAHDMSRLLHTDTYVGRNCFVGAHAIIMPGVRVGDQCIIGSGSVVTRDVPCHSMVGGNPAKVIRSGIRTRKWGILEDIHAGIIAEEERERARASNARR